MRDGGSRRAGRWPVWGWVGLALVSIFWPLNWGLPGLRTHWGFFPLWLGYCLVVDALALRVRGTSMIARGPWRYAALYLLSAPGWWLFEVLNWRVANWVYLGRERFDDLSYFAFASLCFSTVIPAVFGTAELVAAWGALRRLGCRGPRIAPSPRVVWGMFCCGWVMLGALLAWPRYCFPFLWVSILFLIEPVNVWCGFASLFDGARRGDYRIVAALWGGVLICGFFWEMWNFFSYPKWVYRVPFVDFLRVFEMPLLGYGGYLPFSLELVSLYHLVAGLAGVSRADRHVWIVGRRRGFSRR